MNPPVNGKIQGLFNAFECFPELFKANLIFKDFSRQSCIFKYFSSLREPCTMWFNDSFFFARDHRIEFSKYDVFLSLGSPVNLGRVGLPQTQVLFFIWPHKFSHLIQCGLMVHTVCLYAKSRY